MHAIGKTKCSWKSYAGASVAVECKGATSSKPSFRKEVKTDDHGEFKVLLPFSVSEHVKTIEGCSVKLIGSSEPNCAVASTATSSSLHLKSRKQGTHIFSAGFFTFKPLKQPNLCNQKPSIQNSKKAVSLPPTDGLAFPPPIQDPAVPDLPPPINHYFLPPLPRLPELPPLPQLPPLPGLPFPPFPGKTTTNSKPAEPLQDKKESHPDLFFPPLPPNPFQPPPLIPNPFQPPPLIPNPFQPPPLIPNPFQPPPLIPNPFQPPPAPLIPFPSIPGLTPSPPPPLLPFPFPPIFPFPRSSPPPPPPSLPFPFPPIFPSPPPSPLIPGIPPASSSKQTSPGLN